MAATWMSRALLFGSLFSFSLSGAACLSPICFICSRLGACPPVIALPLADGVTGTAAGCAAIPVGGFIASRLGIIPPAVAPAGAAGPALAAGGDADSEDCDPRSRYPIARPPTRQRPAIPYTCTARKVGLALDAAVGSIAMPYSPIVLIARESDSMAHGHLSANRPNHQLSVERNDYHALPGCSCTSGC